MSKIKTALVATASACLLFNTCARAQERMVIHARIPYADLNLSTQTGMNSLNHRIARSIRQACGEPTAELTVAADIHRCVAEMRADSSLQVATLEKRTPDVQVAGIDR